MSSVALVRHEDSSLLVLRRRVVELLCTSVVPTVLWLIPVFGQHVTWHVRWDLTVLLLAHDLVPPRPHDLRVLGAIDTVLLFRHKTHKLNTSEVGPCVAGKPLRMPQALVSAHVCTTHAGEKGNEHQCRKEPKLE